MPSWLSIDPTTGKLTGIPDNANVGTLGINVTATDEHNASVTTGFNLTVPDNAPVVMSEIGTQTENTPFSLDVSSHFSDPDIAYGDSLTYSATLANGDPLPSWLSIDPTTGVISSANGASNAGTFTLDVTATDTHGASVSDNFDLTVNGGGAPSQIVNTYTTGDQLLPAVTTLSDGNVVITWQSLNQDGSGWGVYGQIVGADGTPIGSEFRANTTTVDNQLASSVTSLADGGFVVTWASSQDGGDNYNIYGQLYGANGTPVNGEFQINAVVNGLQDQPVVTGLAGGGFVVTWDAPDADEDGIFAQLYSANGQAVGNEFQLNTTTAGTQVNVSVSALHDGGFVAVWQSQPDYVNQPQYDAFAGQDGWAAASICSSSARTAHRLEPRLWSTHSGRISTS